MRLRLRAGLKNSRAARIRSQEEADSLTNLYRRSASGAFRFFDDWNVKSALDNRHLSNCHLLIAVLLFFDLHPISVANCKKGGIVIYTALVIISSILSAMW